MSADKKGKILRVKKGYNPNSSSIGSIVFAIPTMLFVGATLFGTASAVIFSKYLKKTQDDQASQGGQDPQESDQ